MVAVRREPARVGHRHQQFVRRRHRNKRRLDNTGRLYTKERRNSNLADPVGLTVGGIPGTIDIVVSKLSKTRSSRTSPNTLQSPTVDDPFGVKIASLLISTEASEQNQFILTASDANASTIYLVVRSSTPLADGSLTVGLEVPVLDESKMIYISYCATFDTSKASPLTAMECVKDGRGVLENSSQLFSYNPVNGVIKPMWLESSLLNEASSQRPVGTSAPPVNAHSNPRILATTQSVSKDTESTSVPEAQNVSLVFTPELNPVTPVVNSRTTKTSTLPPNTPLPTPSSEGGSIANASATGRSIAIAPNSSETGIPTGSPAPLEITQPTARENGDFMHSSQAVSDADFTQREAPTSTPGASGPSLSTGPSSHSTLLASSLPTKKRRCDTSTGIAGGEGCEAASSWPVAYSSSHAEGVERQEYDASSLTTVDTGYAWRFSPLESSQPAV